jgi:hypothetical protein
MILDLVLHGVAALIVLGLMITVVRDMRRSR